MCETCQCSTNSVKVGHPAMYLLQTCTTYACTCVSVYVCKRNFYCTHTELLFEEDGGGVGGDKVCVMWLFRGAEESVVRRPSFPSPVLLQH